MQVPLQLFHSLLVLSNNHVAARTLFPPTRTCTNINCPKQHTGSLLRRKDDPRKAVLFTLGEGACPTYSIHLYCYGVVNCLCFCAPTNLTCLIYRQNAVLATNIVILSKTTPAHITKESQMLLRSASISLLNARSSISLRVLCFYHGR